ncbi:signal peptide peptidase SppA [Planctomycetota bacterium]
MGKWLRLFVGVLPVLGGCIYAPFDLGLDKIGELVEAKVVAGSSDDKILLVRIDGEITDRAEAEGILGSSPPTTSAVREVLDLARLDDTVKGVLLRVNSPGGGVTASDIVYRELRRFREDTKKPVVAFCLDTAASGGYYVAQAADLIVAGPTSITGSIGVVAMFPNVSELGQKLGVAVTTLTSGKRKDLGNPFRPMEKHEQKILQDLIDTMHERFVEVVLAGRKRVLGKRGIPVAELRRFADGRVFTAREAHRNKLVDDIGYFEDALKHVERIARVKDPQVVTYERRVFGAARPTVYSERAAARTVAPLPGVPSALGERGGDVNLIKVSPSPSWLRRKGPVMKYLWIPGA